ncbi:hypothetical protein K431DRAFT_307113 [Polychaeton citri CBS 116435]|uniref:Zn(2)-C6 fungal-type domain-containing protein n=1 Tax=Polychaeton citri CBS 116435 TaxID=1314669 RepID=A0A9P4ULF8_9PEZI|nr:hypothetical protein K431DRAFT_307113 [Polychaeton citri CBS 116435]
MSSASTPVTRRQHDRVSIACDLCKRRKVKCDGKRPCAYCVRRGGFDICTYSAQRPRKSTPSAHTPQSPQVPAHPAGVDHSRRRSLSTAEDEHTHVPLEAGLLRDSEGKLIFIGDSAPLSFLLTVRQLLTSKVDPQAFAGQSSRDAIIEHAASCRTISPEERPLLNHAEVQTLLEAYLTCTSGLIDLFSETRLHEDVCSYLINHREDGEHATICQLVIAIGAQDLDNSLADVYFAQARSNMLSKYCGNMNLNVIQGFVLMTVYLLRAAQPNLAFLYFGLAARTAYAIGVHRTEVNAHFGDDRHEQRDRTWKSLRIVDLFLSTSLGRPPALSDVDCTVSYGFDKPDEIHQIEGNLLDASIQVFLIIETVIVNVYSRKKISLRLATEVSQQLKKWASRWLKPLSQVLDETLEPDKAQPRYQRLRTGVSQVLCSYYYSVMLLTRPFLVYDLHEYLSSACPALAVSQRLQSEKANFAFAALDAAGLFVNLVHRLVSSNLLSGRMPVIVSWLFTTALVLALAVLGPTGRAYQAHAQKSIECLRHFASTDANARQHASIAESLLETVLKFVDEVEKRDRSKRSQISSQLFGLPSSEDSSLTEAAGVLNANGHSDNYMTALPSASTSSAEGMDAALVNWAGFDTDFFALPWTHDGEAEIHHGFESGRAQANFVLTDLPLFPITAGVMETNAPD